MQHFVRRIHRRPSNNKQRRYIASMPSINNYDLPFSLAIHSVEKGREQLVNFANEY